MEIDELKNMKAPFDVIDIKSNERSTVSGFSQNDPLEVGGGLFPDMPTVYFENGGWLLLQDFLQNHRLANTQDDLKRAIKIPEKCRT